MRRMTLIIDAVLVLVLLSAIVVFGATADAKTITVMEIDTGVDLTHKEIRDHVKRTTIDDYIDYDIHGTHIAGTILKGTCKQVQLISCKIYTTRAEQDIIANSLYCLTKANLLKVDFINYSSTGNINYLREYELLKKVTSNGTKVIVAAGNQGESLKYTKIYPAEYQLDNIIVVGNLDHNGEKHRTSNYGWPGMVWEHGTDTYSTLPNGKYGRLTGTSMATAVHTNRLLKRECGRMK